MFFTGFAVSQVAENKTVVKVHALEIIDANGKTRAEFSTEEDGAAMLRFFDEHGNLEWEATPRARLMPLKH